jgi:hypothetical protein
VNMLRLSNNPIELNSSDLKKIIIDRSLWFFTNLS